LVSYVNGVGTGRNPQVSKIWHNGKNGNRRQRQHRTQYRYQVWNSQTWRRLSCTRWKRVQPADTRKSRWTSKITSSGYCRDVSKIATS